MPDDIDYMRNTRSDYHQVYKTANQLFYQSVGSKHGQDRYAKWHLAPLTSVAFATVYYGYYRAAMSTTTPL